MIERKKIMGMYFLQLFGTACKLPVDTDAIRRVSMIQPLFYFSLRISLVSKMVAHIRMEQILFYSARKFR